MRERAGFTLIELMIAIAIVGIVAVIATSNFELWLSHNSAVDFQREFLGQVHEAKARSMAWSRQYRLVLNLGAETVTLQQGDAGTGSLAWTDVRSALAGSRGAGITSITYLPGGATVNAGSVAFIFNPDGQVLDQPDPANPAATPLTEVQIRLSSGSAGDHDRIDLYGWTSKARLVNHAW